MEALVVIAVLVITLAPLVTELVKSLLTHFTQDVPLEVIKEKLKEITPEFKEHQKELDEVFKELDQSSKTGQFSCPIPDARKSDR